jgi:hypothetical protein
MPETVTTYTDEELGLGLNWDINPEDGQPLSPAIRRELRESRITRLQRDEAVKRAEFAERQVAFIAAGVTPDVRGEYFAKAYEGATDTDTVKAAWEALFPPEAAQGSQEDPAAGQRRIANAAGGEAPGGSSAIDIGEQLRAARGDRKKIMEILSSPEAREAGLRMKGLD